jgi:hypothetical protein
MRSRAIRLGPSRKRRGLRGWAPVVLPLLTGLSTPAFAQAPVPNAALAAQSAVSRAAVGIAESNDASALKAFLALLACYRKYPENFSLLDKGVKTFDDVDPRVVVTLPKSVLDARIKYYAKDYASYSETERKTENELKLIKEKLKSTPFSDYNNRNEIEVKASALEGRRKQVRRVLFLLSVDANTSILEALRTLPADKRVYAEKKPRPRMPGQYQGSREERLKMTEAEKINLTPVDAEFYKTQLGQKLASDLGGKIDYWSYDFATDKLYVVGQQGDLAEVRVKQDSPSARFIQTRVGPQFTEPRGSDTRVELANSGGRFLTGEKSEETLFGRMPKGGPRFTDELPAGHSAGDGHDHDHDHGH